MRATLFGLGVGTLMSVLVFVAVTDRSQAFAERLHTGSPATSQDLIAVQGSIVGGQQLLTVVDRQQRAMSVYHIDVQTGQIKLRCVRNFRWDLELDEFNGADPSPHKIQSVLQAR